MTCMYQGHLRKKVYCIFPSWRVSFMNGVQQELRTLQQPAKLSGLCSLPLQGQAISEARLYKTYWCRPYQYVQQRTLLGYLYHMVQRPPHTQHAQISSSWLHNPEGSRTDPHNIYCQALPCYNEQNTCSSQQNVSQLKVVRLISYFQSYFLRL